MFCKLRAAADRGMSQIAAVTLGDCEALEAPHDEE
jgi:hypothetical protein